MQNFGASLGGPARRNRTFFFFSYEVMRLRQPFAWRAAVPDASVRLVAADWVRPLLDLFPLPNGPELGPGLAEWTGRNNRPSRFDAGNVRIDHALTSHIAFFGRYNQTPSASELNGTQVNRIAMESRGLTLGFNLRLGASAAVDLRMNTSEANLRSSWGSPGSSACDLQPVVLFLVRRPGACHYLLRFSIAGVGQVVSGSEPYQRQAQWHVAPALVVSHGGHEIRLGADYLQLRPVRDDPNHSLGVIAESFQRMVTGTDLWTAVSGPQNRHSILKEASVFSQDTWRIHPQLTASFGLRWEFAPPAELKTIPYPSSPLPLWVFSNQKTTWQRTYENFAPRVGLAYRPAAESRTVLRAGWGIYYDSSLSVATDVVNGGPFNLSQYSSAVHAPFSTLLSYGFMPRLQLPSVRQWSAAVEHEFGSRQLVSPAYVGSSGRQLLRRELGGLPNFKNLVLALATNNGRAGYQGLEVQYRLKLLPRFIRLAS